MADTLLIDLFKQLASITVQLAKQEINLLAGCLETNEGIKKYIFEDKAWDLPPVRGGHIVKNLINIVLVPYHVSLEFTAVSVTKQLKIPNGPKSCDW